MKRAPRGFWSTFFYYRRKAGPPAVR